MSVESKCSGKPACYFDGCEQNDVKQRKEHGKVTLRCHPQLNVRHTLERALNLCHSADNTHQSHQRKRQAKHRQQISDENNGCRRHKQKLICEPKLGTKQDWKPDCHSGKIAIQQHRNILAIPRILSNHIVHRPQVNASAELKTKCQHHINPRTNRLWNPVVVHWHCKRRNLLFHQYSTSHSTFMPARSLSRQSSFANLMRTGTRCSTFTKFPVALSCGIIE